MGSLNDSQASKVDASDRKVYVSATDTTPGFLEQKVVQGTNIVITKLNPGNTEQLSFASALSDSKKVKITASDTTENYLSNKLVSGNGSTVTNTNVTVTINSANTQLAMTLNSGKPCVEGDVLGLLAPNFNYALPQNNTEYENRIMGIAASAKSGGQAVNVINGGIARVAFVETTPTVGATCWLSSTAGKATISLPSPIVYPGNNRLVHVGKIVAAGGTNWAYVALNLSRTTDAYGYTYKRVLLDGYDENWWPLYESVTGPFLDLVNYYSPTFSMINYSDNTSYPKTQQTNGKYDNCITFPYEGGSGSPFNAIDTNGNTSTWSGAKFTLIGWFRYNTANSTAGSLISKFGGHGATHCCSIQVNLVTSKVSFLLRVNSSGSYYTGQVDVNTTTALPVGSWSLLAMTWDGTTITAYVNGVSRGTATRAGTIVDWGATPGQWRIGDMNDSPNDSVAFSVSDIRTCSTVRSAAYLLEMYRKASGIKY